jgi:hypothetical protein
MAPMSSPIRRAGIPSADGAKWTRHRRVLAISCRS